MKKTESTKVAVLGASGYTGEELVRLLLRHPAAELVGVTSRQYAGKTVAEVFPRASSYSGANTLRFSEPAPEKNASIAEVAFLALPHGVAVEFAGPLLQAGARVIDLSADFRIKNPATYREFYARDHGAPDLLGNAVYGLPEIYRNKISEARLVACPGCYPTSILLPLIPLLREKL
ncbi:MAG TPA: N-acetyl-gamma-glutamyl-phosphate reductase, partial [Chthoniobacterales bacterium]